MTLGVIEGSSTLWQKKIQMDLENPKAASELDLGTNTSPGAQSKSWVMDEIDPEVAANVREYGDAIPDERRQVYDAQSFRTNPNYVPSQAATVVNGRQVGGMQHKDILPDKFAGKTPWTDYKRHFEVCMLLNGWGDVEAGHYLATRLQGQALKVLSNLPVDAPISYRHLARQLERRFGPGEQAENFLLELRMRRRGRDETLQELGQSIRDLTALAYPELDNTARERLARGHFSEAIDEPEIRGGIFRAQARTLDEAIRAGLATESFLKVEKARERGRQTRQVRLVDAKPEPVPVDERTRREIEELKTSFKTLATMLEKLTTKSATDKTEVACYT